MQPVPDLRVLDLAEPPVDVQQEVVELGVVRSVVEPEVVVEFRRLEQRPDLRTHRGKLRRVHRRDLRVLVEKLFEPGDVAVALGTRHRRDEVVDDRRVRAPLGLRALAGVVHEERIDQGEVTERGVRPAGRGQRRGLPR